MASRAVLQDAPRYDLARAIHVDFARMQAADILKVDGPEVRLGDLRRPCKEFTAETSRAMAAAIIMSVIVEGSPIPALATAALGTLSAGGPSSAVPGLLATQSRVPDGPDVSDRSAFRLRLHPCARVSEQNMSEATTVHSVLRSFLLNLCL